MANKYFNVKDGIKSGNITLEATSGNANLGNIKSTGVVSAVDLILSGNVRSNLLPNVTNTFSLGSSSYVFTDVFVANSIALAGQTIVGNTEANTVVISGNVVIAQANVTNIKVTDKITTANFRVTELANIENILVANQANFSNGISVSVLATLNELRVTTTANTANLTVTNTATIETLSANNITGNSLTINLDAEIKGNLAVNKQLVINSTTDSTTADTGAIVVKGGVGIEKDLTVGGNINLATQTNKTPKAGINYNDSGTGSIDFGFK